MRARGAFTLLEMLFATALFALLVSLIYGSYIYCVRTISRCQTGYGPFRDAIRLQKLITRMLASASAVKQRNAKATFEGDEGRLSFTTLNRQGYDPDHPWPLAYVKITTDRDSGMTVIAHPTWFLLDKDDADNGLKQAFPTAREVKIEYLDDKDLVHEWDASKKGKLPRGVHFELKLSGEGAGDLAWSFDVPLPVQPDLPIASGVAAGIPGQPGVSALPGTPGLLPGQPAPLPGAAGFVPVQPSTPATPGAVLSPNGDPISGGGM